MAALVNVHGSLTTTTGTHQIAFTPAVGELLVVFVINTGQTATPTVTDDQGGTYTLINSALKAVSVDKMFVFIRTALVASAVATTVSEAPGASSGGGLLVARISGMQKLGAAAARTNGKQENQSAGTPAPVFSQAPLTTNLCLGAIGNSTNPATMTAPASWSERLDSGYNTPSTGLEVATRDSGQTATTITWGSASASEFCALILELDASIDASATPAVVAAVAAVPAETASGTASTSPATVAGIAATPAAAAQGAGVGSPSAVAAVASVPAATGVGGVAATATPSVVAAVAAVPAPTVSGTGTASPASAAAVTTVPAATGRGAAVAGPSAVAAIASVLTGAFTGDALANPVVVVATSSVPSPAVLAAALALPAGITLAAVIPAPDAQGAGGATPALVAAVVSIPQPTIITGLSAIALPQTVALVATVPLVLAGTFRDLVWRPLGLAGEWSCELDPQHWRSTLGESEWLAEVAKE